VVRSPWEASPESEASLKNKEPAVALAPIPVAGTAAYTFGMSVGLGEVRAAGSGGSNDPACIGVSSIAFAIASHVSPWLGRSEDVWVAASFPATTSSTAGGGSMAAPARVISPTSVGSALVAASGMETASVGASGQAGSSALFLLAAGSNRGERRSSPMRPKSLPVSSLRALFLHEGSEAGITVSSEVGAGGGCVARSMERGDLQRRHPMIESIRAAAAK
jgi:hypothetical protein